LPVGKSLQKRGGDAARQERSTSGYNFATGAVVCLPFNGMIVLPLRPSRRLDQAKQDTHDRLKPLYRRTWKAAWHQSEVVIFIFKAPPSKVDTIACM